MFIVSFLDYDVVGTNVQNIKEHLKTYKSLDLEKDIDNVSANIDSCVSKVNKVVICYFSLSFGCC